MARSKSQKPAPTNSPVIWQPNPGPQTQFLSSTAFEVLYGGAAGGGKSAALVAMPLRWVHEPGFYSVILRRETTQLGDLIKKAGAVYQHGEFSGGTRAKPYLHWTYPSGAELRFGHCQHEEDAKKYQGHEINLLALDELTHFTRKQYQELISRVRTTNPRLPRWVRATTNPGGVGHEWVFARFGPWLDPEFEAPGLPPRTTADGERLPPAKPGQILWVKPSLDGEQFFARPTRGTLSRQFIPALLEDNPHLAKNDPEYETRLYDNDPVRVEQLRFGNWLAKPGAGKLFQRGWFRFCDRGEVPASLVRVRAWDRAATEEKLRAGRTTNDPDYSAGCGYGFNPETGDFYLWDMQWFRAKPGDVFRAIESTAEIDGPGVPIALEQEPGASGKFEVHAYIQALSRFNVFAVIPTGSKVVRAGPVSAQAKAGNIILVRGAWNEPFIREAEAFPDGPHDDQVDATSLAHMAITSLTPARRRRRHFI